MIARPIPDEPSQSHLRDVSRGDVPAPATGSTAARFAPTIPDLVFLTLLFALLAAWGPRLVTADGDTFSHIRLGQIILARSGLPAHDPLVWPATAAPFTAHEWLTDVLFATLDRTWGLWGIVALAALLIALALRLLCGWLLWRGANAYLALMGTLAAAAVATVHFLARPHLFSLAFGLAYLIILDVWRHKQRHRLLLTLPLIMLAWANLHGGFLLGLILIGVHLAADLASWLQIGEHASSERALRLTGIWLLSLAATFANPLGPALYPRLWRYGTDAYMMAHTPEFLSPAFAMGGFSVLALALALSLAARLALGRSEPRRTERTQRAHGGEETFASPQPNTFSSPESDPRTTDNGQRTTDIVDVLLLACLTVMALSMARNAVLLALLGMPAMVSTAEMALRRLARTGDGIRRGSGRAVALGFTRSAARFPEAARSPARAWWSGLASLGVLVWFIWRGPAPMDLTQAAGPAGPLPVAAVSWLAAHPPPGRPFNEFAWGGYLEWRLPGFRPYIDGLSDFDDDGSLMTYAAVTNPDLDWQSRLDRLGVGWLFVPSGSPLAVVAGTSPRWRVAYHDSVAVILVRISP